MWKPKYTKRIGNAAVGLMIQFKDEVRFSTNRYLDEADYAGALAVTTLHPKPVWSYVPAVYLSGPQWLRVHARPPEGRPLYAGDTFKLDFPPAPAPGPCDLLANFMRQKAQHEEDQDLHTT